MYKKIALALLLLVLMFIWSLACEYHGFVRGYAIGTKNTNNWWINKKSWQLEKPEVQKNDIIFKYNII